jgi:hypothetical protein
VKKAQNAIELNSSSVSSGAHQLSSSNNNNNKRLAQSWKHMKTKLQRKNTSGFVSYEAPEPTNPPTNPNLQSSFVSGSKN